MTSKCCGRERRGSMINFTHQSDSCSSICPPGTEKSTVVPISAGNLAIDETVDIPVEFDPKCTNSDITADINLQITINMRR